MREIPIYRCSWKIITRRNGVFAH